MIFYIVLSSLVAVFCFLEYSPLKKDYKNIKILSKQFNDYIDSGGKSHRPSNATFTELYSKRYGKEEHPQDVLKIKGNIYNQFKVDVVGSFPTLDPAVAKTQIILLRNLEDYYQKRLQDVRSIEYWIRFILSLPIKLLKYIGINEDSAFSKLIQVLFWIISLFWIPLKHLIADFVDFMITNKIS